MADSKISGLPVAGTLDGTEIFPLVQSGVTKQTTLESVVGDVIISNRVIVKQASDLAGTLDSSKQYFIDGVIDMGTTEIEIPAGGLYLYGMGFDVSVLTSSEPNYNMFVSAVGGSGNLVFSEMTLTTSGASSAVYNLDNPVDNFRAVEIRAVNFDNCTSLGEITDYRQYLETGTGRFGNAPELTFSGNMNGVRISTSIVRSLNNITSLFKAGTALAFSGRFLTDINCDLNTTGALVDFSDSNFVNDESLQLNGCIVTRNGVVDGDDTTIYPNMDNTSVKSKWQDNVGLPNTNKYIKSNCTTEVTTVISSQSTYYPLAGTFTVETATHFDMPTNGEFRLLTGNGTYQISGDFIIEGSSNNVIDIRVTKSSDGGATWPVVINHVKRQINSLVGSRDVAFFPINFISDIKKDERVRLEVENTSSTGNVTMELDSYFIITQV